MFDRPRRQRNSQRNDQRYARGLEGRFESIVKEHQRAVLTYARSVTGSHTLAEDVTQETFLRAWRYLDSFRGSGSFEGWLLRICRHCAFDQLKANKADAELPRVGLNQPADYRVETLLVMDSLRIEHREVLVLCKLLGYDYESAALVLDLPVGTVRSRLHRARNELAASLDADARQTNGGQTNGGQTNASRFA